jgi:hypothetical protein
MQGTTEVLVPACGGSFWTTLSGLSSFRALRDSQVGSGQKEQLGEEALHWESSVFRDR